MAVFERSSRPPVRMPPAPERTGPNARFDRSPAGNVSGAMYAEYQVPESVPDVPAMPDAPPGTGIPADPTGPVDPEPQAIAA